VSSNQESFLLYEDTAEYDLWLKLLLGGILAFTLIMGFFLLPVDRTGAYIFLGVTVFYALLFYAILPQRYQIWTDRVRIVLGRPLAVNIPLATIQEARSASGSKAFAYWGVRFATSLKNVVEIVRHRGLNFVISPSNRELFLERLAEALKTLSNN
jgi:hypothetical protein